MSRVNLQTSHVSICGKPPLRVVITEASDHVARSLAYRLLTENVFEPNQEIILSLFDEHTLFLDSLIIELTSSAPALLKDIILSSDPKLAFKDADVVFVVGTARDYNFGINDPSEDPFFIDSAIKAKRDAKSIERYAKKLAKIVTLSSTVAEVVAEYAPKIPRENITAVTLGLENFAAGEIATKLGRQPSIVKNLLIWGTNGREVFPCCDRASLRNGPTVIEAIDDIAWCKRELPKLVDTSFSKCRYRLSEALTLAEHYKILTHGTPEDEWICMSVVSDGSYGVPPGLCFAFPVHCSQGRWQIVQDLHIDDYCQRAIKELVTALEKKHHAALVICKNPPPTKRISRINRTSIVKWK